MKLIIWKPRTQYESILPLLRMNEIFGLRIFELSGRLRYAGSIIYIFIFVIFYVTSLGVSTSQEYLQWPVYEEISYKFVLYINIVVSITFIVLGLINTECSKKLIARCGQIDTTLESFGIKKDYQKLSWRIIYSLIAWILVMMIGYIVNLIWCISDSRVRHGFYFSVVIFLPIAIISMATFTFYMFIRILMNKLHVINETLNEICQLSNVNDINVKYKMQSYTAHKVIVVMDYDNRKHFVQHFLQVTRHVHLEIVRISREVNDIYSYQLLFELAVEFIIIITTLYNAYYNTAIPDLNFPQHQFIFITLWFSLSSIKIIVFNNQCTFLYREADTMAVRIHDVGSSYFDSCIKNEVEQFALQLTLHPINITAGGSVVFSNSFTTLFFGTIITYLGIIIQIGATPDAEQTITEFLRNK